MDKNDVKICSRHFFCVCKETTVKEYLLHLNSVAFSENLSHVTLFRKIRCKGTAFFDICKYFRRKIRKKQRHWTLFFLPLCAEMLFRNNQIVVLLAFLEEEILVIE